MKKIRKCIEWKFNFYYYTVFPNKLVLTNDQDYSLLLIYKPIKNLIRNIE